MIVRSSTEVGHLVRDHRTQRGLTQAHLASQVGVSRKWIIDLEAGKRTADLSLVLRTLNALGVELDARARSAARARDSGIDLDEIIERARSRKR